MQGQSPGAVAAPSTGKSVGLGPRAGRRGRRLPAP